MRSPDILLAWRSADPAAVRTLLATVGFAARPDGDLAVPGLVVRVEGGTPHDRLTEIAGSSGPAALRHADARRRPSGAGGRPDAAVRLLAVGWATVDIERASERAGGSGHPLPPDETLGARVHATADPRRVLLEPSTEGRLAAALARNGEGPAALYLAVGGGVEASVVAGLVARGERPRRGNGPFGPQVLARSRPTWGPHLLLVWPASPTVPDRPDETVRDLGPAAGGPSATISPMTDAETAIAFRDAVPADADWIAGLLSDEGYPAGGSDIVRRLERFAEIGSLVRVAERGDEPLGFLALHVVPRFEHDDCIARVIAMVVDPAVRSRGIGRALLADVDRIAAEAGAAFVEVTAGHHRQDARRLFEAAGFDTSLTTYLRKRV